MQITVSEDVDAPAELVWQRLTDFSAAEDMAKGRGVELSRVGNWAAASEGAEWRGQVTVRGKSRKIKSKITGFVPEDSYTVESKIGGMETAYAVTLVLLSQQVTRVNATLDLTAQTLTSRLILQTMKLARGRITQRLQSLVTRQGNDAEAAYRRSLSG